MNVFGDEKESESASKLDLDLAVVVVLVPVMALVGRNEWLPRRVQRKVCPLKLKLEPMKR